MKSFYKYFPKTTAIIFLFLFVQTADAGTRYRDIVFPSATITRGIQFGSNTNIDGTNATLFLDLYQPTNDTVKLRPLVICIHGGSLISGNKFEMDPFCTDFAERGYVAATIDYRIGIESPKGVRTILEALLRGVQDAKGAVRFFRSKAAEYGIDTSRIYLEGSSAGSMIAVHYAYWSEDEIPADINQAKWGDIEGTSGNPGYSTGIKGVINYCGALVDPTWIKAGEVPVANFHGLLDMVVPPDGGVSTDFGIRLYGGVAISRAATQLDIYNQGAFFPLMGHGGNTDSLIVFSSNFLYTLMVLASTPQQDFSSFALTTKSLNVFRYDTFTFVPTALDNSGNRIVLPQTMIQYSCDSRIGTMSHGVFTPADIPYSGYASAKFNNTTDSCYIKTYDLKYFIISPKNTVIDTIKTLQLSIATYDANSVLLNLAITKFKLTSTNPAVGTVDSTGLFTGKKNGTTSIIATCSGYSDTCAISVESASGIVNFDGLESLSGWTFTNDNLDSLSVTLATDQKSEGNASFKINYKFTFDSQKPSYMVYLNKDIPVYGIPDSIYLDVKSDGRNHRLYYRFTDADSGIFRATGKKYLNNSTAFDNINAPMTGLVPISGNSNLTYPLTFNRMEIQLAGNMVQGQTTSGTIYVDNLRLKYPGTATGVEKNQVTPSVFSLEQNYPNPFNPSTIIRYSISNSSNVVIKVYDILGKEVQTILEGYKQAGTYEVEFSAKNLSSGIYFYQMRTDKFIETKKMLLLR